MGSIHYQFNLFCDQTIFAAVLNSENSGINSIAQSFFDLNSSIVNVIFGFSQSLNGADIKIFRFQISVNLIFGIE
jgi:hypothetical protein